MCCKTMTYVCAFLLQCKHETILPGDETLHIFRHYVHSRVEQMRGYLKKFMITHKYFVDAVGGFLIRKKGQQVQDYMDYIVQSQTPIDEVAIVLLARMWKIHVCVFLEGKYWTTNKDLVLNKASIYLVFGGETHFMILLGKVVCIGVWWKHQTLNITCVN